MMLFPGITRMFWKERGGEVPGSEVMLVLMHPTLSTYVPTARPSATL